MGAIRGIAIVLALIVMANVNSSVKGQSCTCCPGHSSSNPATSCSQIYQTCTPAPSGYYWIRTTTSVRKVYCNMDINSCGSRGLMRVSYFDMRDPTATCPGSLSLYQSGGKRMCGVPRQNGCYSLYYPTNGYRYSRVCGRARGYTYFASASNMCAFYSGEKTLNDNYLIGLSVTKGPTYSRDHVWSFASGFNEAADAQTCNCPCSANPGTLPEPSEVGTDYFCETSLQYRAPATGQWYTNNTLWDGECYPGSNCCNNPTLPYFYKLYPTTSSDIIEVRFCGFSSIAEAVAAELLEIYVA